MINRNIIKTCLYPFKNNKYYKILLKQKRKYTVKISYNDKIDNRQKW